MSRRATWSQAFDAWTILRDALANPNYCIHENDCESVTVYKLGKQRQLRENINVLSSYLANPDTNHRDMVDKMNNIIFKGETNE